MTDADQRQPGVSSEVGRLRTVLLHRPGPELQRLTPRNNDKLLFDGIPWVTRAQEEHDAFAEALRGRGVEVLYLTELLVETLASEAARDHAIQGGHRVAPARRHDARLPPQGAHRDVAGRAQGRAHRRAAQRRGPRWLRAGHQPAAQRRLPDRPAAQPAVHPRLERLDPRQGRDHLAGDAGPRAREPADRADLHRAPALRLVAEDPRLAPRARRGRRRTPARARTCSPSASGSVRRPQVSSAWPARSSRPGMPTPCSPYPSPRNARPCTSTPCARWSTSTRS